MPNDLPTIEIAVGLPTDGNPAFSLRSTNMKSDHDFELLVAAAFNGLNLHLSNYAKHQDHPLDQVQRRIEKMIRVMAQGNETSPMTYEAYDATPPTDGDEDTLQR